MKVIVRQPGLHGVAPAISGVAGRTPGRVEELLPGVVRQGAAGGRQGTGHRCETRYRRHLEPDRPGSPGSPPASPAKNPGHRRSRRPYGGGFQVVGLAGARRWYIWGRPHGCRGFLGRRVSWSPERWWTTPSSRLAMRAGMALGASSCIQQRRRHLRPGAAPPGLGWPVPPRARVASRQGWHGGAYGDRRWSR